MIRMQRIFACLAILTCGMARADVPWASNLQEDARAARALRGVVLVVFVRQGCPYCETALKQFLIPMSGNADYLSRVVMRRVESDGLRDLTDFHGNQLSHAEFGAALGVRLTPTVMVFDGDGKRLAKPVIGVTTLDYYGAFLDAAIDQGVTRVRAGIGSMLGRVPPLP